MGQGWERGMGAWLDRRRQGVSGAVHPLSSTCSSRPLLPGLQVSPGSGFWACKGWQQTSNRLQLLLLRWQRNSTTRLVGQRAISWTRQA